MDQITVTDRAGDQQTAGQSAKALSKKRPGPKPKSVGQTDIAVSSSGADASQFQVALDPESRVLLGWYCTSRAVAADAVVAGVLREFLLYVRERRQVYDAWLATIEKAKLDELFETKSSNGA